MFLLFYIPGGWERKPADAIADVLFGDYNPSAKLPISFPEIRRTNPDLLQSLSIPAVRQKMIATCFMCLPILIFPSIRNFLLAMD